jgi:hypothetical protein
LNDPGAAAISKPDADMKKQLIPPTTAFPLTAEQRLSFATAPTAYRLSGPPGLVRLVQNGGLKTGAFWFSETVFSRLRAQAKADLARQSAGHKEPFSRPMKEMVGMYMRHCLRQDLAICKDWTENFDSYAVLPLRPQDTLIAWVGKIRPQPYYAKPDPAKFTKAEYADRLRVFEQAEAGGVSLLAGEDQFVIDFRFSANRALESRILGPWEF